MLQKKKECHYDYVLKEGKGISLGDEAFVEMANYAMLFKTTHNKIYSRGEGGGVWSSEMGSFLSEAEPEDGQVEASSSNQEL